MALEFHLGQIVRKAQAKAGLTDADLADELGIDGRRLASLLNTSTLADPEPAGKKKRGRAKGSLTLNLDDFVRIERFLRKHSDSLTFRSLFQHADRSLLDSLVSLGKRILIIIGGRPKDSRMDIAWWDVRSLEWLINKIRASNSSLDIELRCIPIGQENTTEVLKLIEKSSVLCLGSPRSCPLAGQAWSIFMGEELNSTEAPFQFGWGWINDQEKPEPVQSPLVRTGKKGFNQFWHRGELFLSEPILPRQPPRRNPAESNFHDVGALGAKIIGDHALVAVSGLSGPATRMATSALQSIRVDLSTEPFYAIMKCSGVLEWQSAGDPRRPQKIDQFNSYHWVDKKFEELTIQPDFSEIEAELD